MRNGTKKLRYKIIGLLALAWVWMVPVHAQDNTSDYFEGVVEYRMRVEGSDLPPEVVSKIPRSFKIYMKDAASRLEMSTDLSDITVLANNSRKEAFTLMHILGNKLAIKTDSAEFEKALGNLGKYEIKYLSEEKTIMGYPCQKALIIRGNPADTSYFWYTNELLPLFPSSNQFLPQGNWFPMEVHATHQGVRTTLSVQSIEKRPLKDNLFIVPEDYQVIEQGKIRERLLGL